MVFGTGDPNHTLTWTSPTGHRYDSPPTGYGLRAPDAVTLPPSGLRGLDIPLDEVHPAKWSTFAG